MWDFLEEVLLRTSFLVTNSFMFDLFGVKIIGKLLSASSLLLSLLILSKFQRKFSFCLTLTNAQFGL